MFTKNSDDQKSSYDSDQPRSACSKSNKKSNVEFESLEEFSSWVDVQLARLEERYYDFETATSVRKHYSR